MDAVDKFILESEDQYLNTTKRLYEEYGADPIGGQVFRKICDVWNQSPRTIHRTLACQASTFLKIFGYGPN